MANENARRDANRVTTALGVTNDVSQETRNLLIDPATGALLVTIGGGGVVVTGADSGLYLNGTIVQLGTNPLIENVVIDGASTFSLGFPNMTTLTGDVATKFEMTRGDYSIFNDAASIFGIDGVGDYWQLGTEAVMSYITGGSKQYSAVYYDSATGITNQMRANDLVVSMSAAGTGYTNVHTVSATEALQQAAAGVISTNFRNTSTDAFINEGTTDTGGTGVATNGQFLKLVDKTTGEVKFGSNNFTTTYSVSSDYGDDTNNGLSIESPFASLEAALNAGEAGGVAYAVNILDDNTYVPQAASGTRTDSVVFSIHAPLAKIEGPVGGLIWKTVDHKILGCEVDGELLTFQPNGTLVTVLQHWDRVTNPNTLFYSFGGTSASYRIELYVQEVVSDSGVSFSNFCDISESARFTMYVNNVYGFIYSGDPILSMFKASGVGTTIWVQANNIDIYGTSVPRYVMEILAGAQGYVTAQHSANNVFGIADGANSVLYAVNVYSNTGTPETYTESSGGRVYTSSPMQGFDLSRLDATAGLDLTDLINVRDLGATAQKKATLSELKALIGGGTVTTAKVADYTAVAGDFVLMTTGAADKTVTLPAAASKTDAVITVKKVDAGAGNVIIDGSGSETIDGALTQTITTTLISITMQSDGTEWWIK